MTIELIFDAVIIILVIVMIVYSYVLNKKLQKFRNAQLEMSDMVNQLNQVVNVTQTTISDLKVSANEEKENLEHLLLKARALSDELSLMTETGENLACRIEQGLTGQSQTSDQSKNTPHQRDRNDDKRDQKGEKKSDKKSNILKKLRNIR